MVEEKEKKFKGINLVTMRMSAHSGHSGYDRLADYMNAGQIAPPEMLSFSDRLIGRCFRRLIENSGSIWYHRSEFLSEIKAAKQWLKSNQVVFHYVYGENSYRYMGKLKNLRPENRIVCTFHTPPEKFQAVVKNTEPLKSIDAVIVMAESQIDFFVGLLGHNNVWFVPHGIDVEFFRPAPEFKSINGALNCLFVGSHLRDFDTLKKVVEISEGDGHNVIFHILINQEKTLRFKNFNNVRLYSKVSEQELLKLYQSADLLVLPLIDCTANNSILEAIACGLPVVTTDLPGTRNYLTDDCALFVPPGDAACMVDAICRMKDIGYRQWLSDNCRQHAQRFDWRVIADQLMGCYSRLW